MTLKNYDKFEEELIWRFKIRMTNLMNFDSKIRKSRKFTL